MFNLTQYIDTLKQSLTGYLIMLSAAVIGLIWISFGIYNFAVAVIGPIWGPIAIGAAFMLPVLVYVVVKKLAPEDKRSKQQRMFDQAFAASPVGALSQMIEKMSAHSPFLGAITAIIGGFVAARFPQFLSITAELVAAGSDELTRWNSAKQERAAQRAADDVRKAAEYERRGSPPPPPDIEPVVKRRGKAKQTADIY